jgi:hypothetical protein
VGLPLGGHLPEAVERPGDLIDDAAAGGRGTPRRDRGQAAQSVVQSGLCLSFGVRFGFREERFQPCLWSSTPWGSCRTCRERSTSLLPSPRQDGVGLRKEMVSEFNTQPGCTSVNASPSRLPG